MTIIIMMKLMLLSILTNGNQHLQVTRMLRVRRIRSMVRNFVSIHPDATDSCGVRISVLLENHIDSLIERHSQAARYHDLDAMRGLESALDVIRSIIVDTMEFNGSINAFPTMKTIQLPA